MRFNHFRPAAAANPSILCRLFTGNFSKPCFLLLATCWLLAVQGIQAQTNWDGSDNTDWFDADNWSAGVPTAATDVSIPGGMPNQPSIGATGALAKSVAVAASATLTITTNGDLTIDGWTDKALSNLGTVNNNGTIVVGPTSTTGNFGIYNEATFNNNSGGLLTLDRGWVTNLRNLSGTFNNDGTITIGGIVGARYGIWNSATFNNNADGQINIDRASSLAPTQGLQNNGSFHNSGALIIGANGNGGENGLQNFGTFNNNAGGEIKIDRTSTAGLGNYTGTFTNASSIIIGANAGVGPFGVWNQSATFNNNSGGEIHIDRAGNSGINNESGFTNSATIIIGANGGVNSAMSNTNGNFNNNTCDALLHIASNSRIFLNSGTISNAGRIIENASDNSAISSNSGIVQNLGGGTFTIGTNTGLLTTFEGALSACCPPGNIYYVNAAATGANDGTSWADAFTDLQSALLSPCATLTQIWVAEGTYKPTNGTDRTISFVMKPGVEILGGFPNTGDPGLGDRDPNPATNGTVLSGDINTAAATDNSYHVVFNNFTSGSPLTGTAVLDGFTITGGYASGIAPHCHGGGMYNLYASPTVTNCIFSNNTAQRSNATSTDSRGGGMYNSYSAPSVTYCTFSGNEARAVNFSGQNYGGAMYNHQSTMTVSHCTFNNNTTPNSDEDTYGGGMCNINMTITINDCTFSGNAACFGGGVYSSNSATTTNNCTFSANALDTYPGGVNGSGMYLNACSGSVSHCAFTGNLDHAALGIQLGSPIEVGYCSFLNNPVYGMTLQTAAPNITNCLFAGNNFGGLANWHGGVSAPVITNCTFSENPTFPNLGAITNYGTSTATLKNCILWGAGPSVHNPNGVVNISYSDVKQTSGVYPGTGNINADPLFVGGTDFHLQNTSPCLNTGTATGAPADDFDGDARPQGGGFDMGYDENTTPCTPPTVNAPSVTQPTCALPTGTIVVDASGGGTLEYSVDNGATWDLNETFAGLAPGNYYIKVRLEANPSCETAYAGNPVELNSPFTASTTTDTWTGCVSTDWATAGNWADGSVPTTAEDVIIPDVANDPVISTAAFARQIEIGANGNLLVEASGSLTISGSPDYGILNIGTVVNEGAIFINGTSGFGINNLTPGSFTNKNLLQIGNLSGVGVGITNDDATFINQGGSITIDRCSGSAIKLNTLGFQNAIFTNDGSITIGSLGTIGTEAISVQKACGGGCQASFSNTSCSALINIVASAANNVITLSGGATFDNNGGRIIENSGGNSSITSNSGYVQNLNGGTFTISTNTGLLTTSTGDIWTGCTSTDWHTTTNWLDGSVPTATDNVNIPNVANDPVISAAAVAKSIHVQTSALLTNNSSLTVNGSATFPPFGSTTAFGNRGTVENNGALIIGNVSSAGNWGIYNVATFNNNADGQITIDRSTSRGLYNQELSGLPGFTNSGSITIGGAAGVGATGLFNNGTFTNNATGTIVLDRATDRGLGAWYGTFTNAGSITIGGTVSTGSYGLENLGTFHNNAGGQITIDRSTSFGLYVNQGTFNNAGGITIGGTAAAGTEGMRNMATFNNNAGGQITIDRSTTNGIRNSGTVFNNAGNITIGGTVGNGQTGIFSSVQFNNNAGGQITIDRSTSIGLWANGPFTNADKIYIGQTAGVGGTGLISQNTFNNNAGGVILIDRCTTTGLVNQSTFNNAATVIIGATASVGATGIQNTNSTTFDNSGCDAFIHIASNSIINNTGTFSNSGRIIENASDNSSITNNSGTVQNLNGGMFSITTNTGGLTTATGDIWTGCLSTDWHTDGNWFDGSVPTAADDAVVPDAINDPVIGAAAAARSVNVEAGGSLTVEATGSLPINSAASPLFTNSGTVVNEGTISLNTTESFKFHRLLNLETGTFTNNNVLQLGTSGSQTIRGIYNRGSFVNATGGSISIAKCNGGIFQDAGSFVNNAGIVFSSVNNFTDSTAIVLFGGTFSNTPCSATILDQPGSNLNRFSAAVGTFTNDGLLTENSSGFSSITNNTGIVQNLGGGGFNITNNTGILTTNPGPQTACCPPGNIFYVNAAATGANNGSSWADAFTDLQNALNSPCTGITQIWVAEGTYKPTSSTDRSIAFAMKDGVEILGGFPNTGDPDLDDRDWVANVTTLSGEIGAAGMADNTNNIIRNGSMGATAVLDGFQLVYGNAQGGNDRGAALHNGANASPSIRNCTFMSNLGGYGGAVYNYTDCTPTFTNCAFIGNEGAAWGALFTEGSSFFTFINCSFSGNMGNPGVIYSNGMPSVLKNCIIWGNGTQAIAGLATITHSIIQGGYAGTGNLDTDPLFVSQPPVGLGVAGDLHLQICSPAIDAANDADAPANDLDGNARFDALAGGSVADMGAYEFQDEATPTVAVCQTSVDAILDNTGEATVLATALNDGSTGCSPLVFSIDGQPSVSFNCSQIGSQSVTLTATYVNRTSTCATTVNVLDNTPPTITCPDNIVKNTDAGQCSSVATYSVTASDNCAYTLTRTSPANTESGSAFPVGTTNVEWSVTDAGGNDTSCAFTVTVNDNTPPDITCPDNIVKNTDAGQCSAVATYTVTASDNCAYTLTRTSPANTGSGSAFPMGTTNVAWSVTDAGGNDTSCAFTVTVTDVQLPGITCPGPVTVTCSGNVPAVNLAAVSATDNCGSPTKSYVGDATSNQTCTNRKTVTRTYRATDGSGNSATCSQVITVFDNVKPNFTSVPANVTVQCNSIPAVGTATATDGCGGAVTVVYNGQTTESGACTDAYTITRQWTATDACGNTKTAAQRINVIDTQKPNFTTMPANVTVQCDAVPAPASPTATDNCDAAVAVTYNGQTQTNGACPNAYTLTRTWTAADNCGNTKTVTQRITVVDNGKPVFTAFPANASISCQETPPAVGTPTASDGCGAATVTYLGQTTVSGNCPGNYQIRRTWRATDACGNSTAATQTISVSDAGAPVFTSTPGPLTIECGDPLPPLVNPTASDACGGYSAITFLGNVPSGSGCAADYTVTRTWRAEDLCGNSATTSQVITVLGNSYGEEGAENREEDATGLIAHRSSLIVTPNPTTDRFWLDLSDFAGEAVTVSIFDDLGRLVWERRIHAVEERKPSVSLLEAGAKVGMYTVSVRSASSVAAKRVVLVE